MRDLVGALVLLSVLTGGLVVTARYAFLAWFQPDVFRITVRHGWPEWRRKKLIFRGVWNWIDTPGYLAVARATTTVVLLFCILLLVVTAGPITSAVLHVLGR